MDWPKWLKVSDWKFWTGISISIIGIIIGIVLSSDKIDSGILAEQLAKHLKDQRTEDKDAEIKELKATIERLQQDTANELKQAALRALSEDDTIKAA